MSEIVKITDLPNGVKGIYKINYPNGKCYIGLSTDIKRRMWEHNNLKKAKTPCDFAIQKYGKIQTIEILERCQNEDELEEREKYWIKYYQSNNRNFGYNITEGGDGSHRAAEENPKAVFTNEQVLDIRKRRFYGERKKDVYQDYSDFSFSTFEHIWLGRGYSDVGAEYLIPTNSKTRQEYSSEANKGTKNGRAKFTEDQVREIRKRYDSGESVDEIHQDYNYVSRSTIHRITHRQVYKDIE